MRRLSSAPRPDFVGALPRSGAAAASLHSLSYPRSSYSNRCARSASMCSSLTPAARA
jgi:hypothetical protein